MEDIRNKLIEDIKISSSTNNISLINLLIDKSIIYLNEICNTELKLEETHDIICDLVCLKLKKDIVSESLGDYSVSFKENSFEYFQIRSRLNRLKSKYNPSSCIW